MNDTQIAAADAALEAWAAPIIAGSSFGSAIHAFLEQHKAELISAVGPPGDRRTALDALAAPIIANASIFTRGAYRSVLSAHGDEIVSVIGGAVDSIPEDTQQ